MAPLCSPLRFDFSRSIQICLFEFLLCCFMVCFGTCYLLFPIYMNWIYLILDLFIEVMLMRNVMDALFAFDALIVSLCRGVIT